MRAPADGRGAAPADAACAHEEGCITCGDVAVALRVLAVDEAAGLARCGDDRGRAETIEIALVAPVAVGDLLLVHAGTAIGRPAQPARPPGAAGGEAGEAPGT